MKQRRAALSAMRYLSEFEPRLVGPVLSGTATEHTEVQLHLFAERAESVTLKLLDEGIPHEVTEKRVKLNPERVRAFPGVRAAAAKEVVAVPRPMRLVDKI